MAANSRRPVVLSLSFKGLLPIVGLFALLWAVWKLSGLLALVAIALLGAVTLAPVMQWLERKRVPHFAAVMLLALGVLSAGFGLWKLIVPPLGAQVEAASEQLTKAEQLLAERKPHSKLLRRLSEEVREFPKSPEAKRLIEKRWSMGFAALQGVTGLAVVLVLMLYLLLEGKRLFAWLVSYVPRSQRRKVGLTAEEVGKVVRAYIRGQLITSFAAGVFMFIALTLLKVPAALPLALFAGVMDVFPVLGIVVSAVPTALLALTVSPGAAVTVVVLLVAYHALENYVLIPLVYGKTLRLSTLSVLLAFMAGGILGGPVGAVMALPVVAAYPIIERYWLAGYLAEETVDEHARMDSRSEQQARRAVDEVAENASGKAH